MLHDSKDMPKFQTITDQKSIEKYGGNRMYFAPPIDYDKVMKLECVSKVSRAEQLCKPDKASCQIYHAQEAPCKLLETHSHSTIILDFHKEALYQVALLVVEIITFPRL